MKKKLVILTTVITMALTTACGSDTNPKSTTSTTVNENISTDASINATEATTEAIKDNVSQIQPALEKDAYVDFSGVKVPMTITWEEFKTFVSDNHWKIVSEEKAPSEENLSGRVNVRTNCGEVQFCFMPDAYDTESVLRDVNIDYDLLTKKVSFCGISSNTKLEDMDKVLEVESTSGDSKTYYLDEYLVITMMDRDDDKFDMSISRLPWTRRKVDIIEHMTHIGSPIAIGEKIVIEAQENTNERIDICGRITMAIPNNWEAQKEDLKTIRYAYKNDISENIDVGYNYANLFTGSTCTEIDFTQDMKTKVDNPRLANSIVRISEVQIGKYRGYEFFNESPSDKRSSVKSYIMWIDGYQVEFYISYYNYVDAAAYEEAFNSLMQAIASIEVTQ